MNIVCCLKQVPDTMQVKIDPDTNTLVREGVERRRRSPSCWTISWAISPRA
jgi:electron transfer flavoprotein alpha/beta subunit